MNRIKHNLLISAAAALPLALATPAFADAGTGVGDRFRVETDVDSSDDLLEDTVVDLRIVSTDEDDRFGVRSRTDSGEVDDLHTDTRAVSQDNDDDAFSTRAILDLGEIDDLDADLDLIIIDDDNDSGVDEVTEAGSEGEADTESGEEMFNEDAEYVFGP